MSSSNFVDYVKVCCRSGKGGGGSKHFHRDRTTAKGGPDGGDGGRGGHIIIKGNKQIWTLLSLKYRKHIIAAPGEAGGANLCFGKSGKDVLEVAKEVALEAGDLLMRRFRSVLEINYKGRGNIVTDVDKEAQDLIQRSLFAEFPEIRFVGEESENPNISNGLCWIVDPIDGTRNFASGIPIFSIVIGLISLCI